MRSQIDVRQSLRREHLPFDPARQLRHRREGDVGIVCAGSGAGIAVAANERIARWAGASLRRPTGFQCVAGASVGFERDLSRPDAPLEQRRHRHPPRASRHVALGGGHGNLRELLRFGKRGGRNGRSGGRSRAERRRALQVAAPEAPAQQARGTRPVPARPSGAVIRNFLRVFMGWGV